MTDDEQALRTLNDEYVRAFLRGDVGWYREHLAEDFTCIESDGSVLDKSAFLDGAARGPDVADYRLQEVAVEIRGGARDVALVRATGRFTRDDGSIGISRYVDVWERRAGGWRTISAQITRRAGEP